MSSANAEIAALLRAYERSKVRTKELRGELVRMAVEHVGLSQEESVKMDLATFLDGYLIGQGMAQSWRLQGEQP